MNVTQRLLRPGRLSSEPRSAMQHWLANCANGMRRWWRHCKLVTIAWLILMLSGCSTTPPVTIPDCPKPPDPVAPPAHLMAPLPEPHRHADAEATSGAQLLVCARNYQEIMRPALRRLQDWRAWSKN